MDTPVTFGSSALELSVLLVSVLLLSVLLVSVFEVSALLVSLLCMPPQKPHVHGVLTACARTQNRSFQHSIQTVPC